MSSVQSMLTLIIMVDFSFLNQINKNFKLSGKFLVDTKLNLAK